MSREALILAVAALILPVLTYFAGVARGRRQRVVDRVQTQDDMAGQRLHDKKEDVVSEYVRMSRENYASGPPALAMLGLELLESDALIREAIREMEVRTGKNPFGRHAHAVADVDLVQFFRYVGENAVNFNNTTVESVAAAVRQKS